MSISILSCYQKFKTTYVIFRHLMPPCTKISGLVAIVGDSVTVLGKLELSDLQFGIRDSAS